MPSVSRHAVLREVFEVLEHVSPLGELHAAVSPSFADQGTETIRGVRDGTHGEFSHGRNAEWIKVGAPNGNLARASSDVLEAWVKLGDDAGLFIAGDAIASSSKESTFFLHGSALIHDGHGWEGGGISKEAMVGEAKEMEVKGRSLCGPEVAATTLTNEVVRSHTTAIKVIARCDDHGEVLISEGIVAKDFGGVSLILNHLAVLRFRPGDARAASEGADSRHSRVF